MARLLLLALVALLVYLLLRSTIRAFVSGLGAAAGGAPRPLRDQLVKDPVCETYVPRRTAIARTAGAETHYFCSPACAAKFRPPA